MRTCTIVWLSV
jgi:hypothetical protein